MEEGVISEEKYNQFLDIYNQFIQMPKTSILQTLSEGHYYYIRNVWFGRYAKYNTSDRGLGVSSAKSEDDTYLWRIKKNDDGTVFIYSKKTETAAYLASNAVDQKVKVGKDYAWTLEERTLDGKSGICIIDGSKKYSWYTNPDAWTYILMKPFWGACTWEFQKSGVEVPTGIGDIEETENGKRETENCYDLSGRQVRKAAKGVYITNGQIVVK